MIMISMCHRDIGGGYVGQYKKSPRKQQVRYIFSKITIIIILTIIIMMEMMMIVIMIEQAPSKPVRKQKRRQQEGDARLGS